MIEFENGEHRYQFRGSEYAGVTATMTAAGLWYFPKVEEAMERGRRVHKATMYYDQGRLDESTVAECDRGYLEAWKKFLLETKFKPNPRLVEFVVKSDVFRYAGRCDVRGTLPGSSKPVYVDRKTGEVHPATAVQLAAYGGADEGIGMRVAVGLRPDGSYSCKIFPFNDFFSDLLLFQACLSVARGKQRLGIR